MYHGKNDNKTNETKKIFLCSCLKHFHISQTLNKKRLSHDRSTNWQLNYLTNICHNFSIRHSWKSECEFAERVRFPGNSRDANIDLAKKHAVLAVFPITDSLSVLLQTQERAKSPRIFKVTVFKNSISTRAFAGR